MYKKGGKKPKAKSSFMEESKELSFGGMKYKNGGLYSAAEQSENIAKVKKMNSMQGPEHQTQVKKKSGGFPDLNRDGKTSFADVLKGRGVGKKQTGGSKGDPIKTVFTPAPKSQSDKEKAFQKIKEKYEGNMPKSGTPLSDQGMGYKKSGNTNTIADKLKKSPTAGQGMGYKKEGNSNTLADRLKKKKTGGKSMEPGGGGRFAAMVSKLKGEGKSEGSAKAIAASIGRKKYGKSKFQEMAAKGKKGLGGMSDSTSANDAGMEMMESMGPKKPKKGSSGSKHTGPNAKRAKNAQKRVQSGRGGCNRGEVCFD